MLLYETRRRYCSSHAAQDVRILRVLVSMFALVRFQYAAGFARTTKFRRPRTGAGMPVPCAAATMTTASHFVLVLVLHLFFFPVLLSILIFVVFLLFPIFISITPLPFLAFRILFFPRAPLILPPFRPSGRLPAPTFYVYDFRGGGGTCARSHPSRQRRTATSTSSSHADDPLPATLSPLEGIRAAKPAATLVVSGHFQARFLKARRPVICRWRGS